MWQIQILLVIHFKPAAEPRKTQQQNTKRSSIGFQSHKNRTQNEFTINSIIL